MLPLLWHNQRTINNAIALAAAAAAVPTTARLPGAGCKLDSTLHGARRAALPVGAAARLGLLGCPANTGPRTALKETMQAANTLRLSPKRLSITLDEYMSPASAVTGPKLKPSTPGRSSSGRFSVLPPQPLRCSYRCHLARSGWVPRCEPATFCSPWAAPRAGMLGWAGRLAPAARRAGPPLLLLPGADPARPRAP
jgi:hypothetical protein